MVAIKKVVQILVLGAFVLAMKPAMAYDALVAFGDSDTDTGNLPSSPPEYWNKRFSNGRVWIEYLAVRLGLTYDASANFAVSGHEASDLGTQINRFWGPGNAKDVLYAIWAGSNDMLNHIGANGTRDSAWDLEINDVVNSVITACDLIYQKGARKIVILNIPDLTRAPSVHSKYSSSFRTYLNGKIRTCNSRLANAIPGLMSSHSGLDVYLVDAFADINYLLDHYADYGFVNATLGALNDPSLTDKSFDGPGANYVFWDMDHYTTKVHELIAQWVAEKIPTGSITPPAVTLTSPSSGANYSAPAAIPLSCTVTANGNSITRVEFLQNGVVVGQDTTAPFSFTLIGAPAGTYGFAARVIYGSGANVSSSTATVTVSPAASSLPSPWLHADIGAVGRVGDAYVASNGTFVVSGAGADIWGSADEFHFVYRQMQGDGSIIARVLSLQNTDGFAKACVMLRETLNPNSRNVAHFLSPEFGTGFQVRASTGGATVYTAGSSKLAPYWLKLERTGSQMKGYSSPDGQTWKLEGTANVSMVSNIYAGFGITAHNDTTLNAAAFAQVEVLPARAPVAPATLAVTRQADGSMRLSLTGTSGATYVCEASPDMATWTPFSTNVIAGTPTIIIDPPGANVAKRYYRAVAHP